MKAGRLRFKIASELAEFAQIARLNHATFSVEIPQHLPSPDGVRVDRFHDGNTYIIGLRDNHLAGMLAVCAERPFSLDGKLANLDAYLPAHTSSCEIRLLAVAPNQRQGMVFRGLIATVWKLCRERGHDLALISGVVNRSRLYERMGFVPFGPVVGSEGAQFQPMYLRIEAFEMRADPFRRP